MAGGVKLLAALLIVFVALLIIVATHQPKTPSALPPPLALSPRLTGDPTTAAPRATPSAASRSRHTEWAGNYTITAYTNTGSPTSSGVWPRYGMVASNHWRFGTRLLIEGLGIFTVTDRVGHGTDIDVFLPTRYDCIRFGRQYRRVQVIR